MSKEFDKYMHSKGINTGHSPPYNPQGNGQVERFNETIWKTITMSLKDKHLPISHWEHVLPDALHAVLSLMLCDTGETPHERLFRHHRKSAIGTVVPSWMSVTGPVPDVGAREAVKV